MKLVGIRQGTYGDTAERIQVLREACDYWQIQYTDIDAFTHDFSDSAIPSNPYLMYRLNAGTEAIYLEGLFLTKYAVSFYKNVSISFTYLFESASISLIMEKAGIPSPKTIYHITTNKMLLERYIDYLGGFPIIFKPLTGNKGLGVIKIDGYHALYPLLEFFEAKGIAGILREYIPHKATKRVMVIGNSAICATHTIPTGNEFRSNIDGNRTDEAIPVTMEISKIAVEAVAALDLEFGGVDIIEDKDGQLKVLEVNFPSGGLMRISELCDVHLGKVMVEYLLKKSKL